MPCTSNYLDQNEREAELQRAAKLLAYVLTMTRQPVSDAISKTAENYYADIDFVPDLCDTLRNLPPEQFEQLVYNARDKTSRDLADWWERHEAADQAREAQEKAAIDRANLVKSAIAKLTPEEITALGLRVK